LSSENDLPLTPISPVRNLRQTVTEHLRTAIIVGDLQEGVVYSAPSLGAAFGVSATPVREAMMDLAREGLVETVKNKGFRVTDVKERDLDEITEIRLLLEPPVVRGVVSTIPAEDFPAMRALADETVTAAEEKDLKAYLVGDRTFHARVLSYAGNSQLVDLATGLRTRTRMYGLKLLVEEGVLPDSAREHHTLLDLMEAGDAEGSYQLMVRHIGHARGLWASGNDQSGDLQVPGTALGAEAPPVSVKGS